MPTKISGSQVSSPNITVTDGFNSGIGEYSIGAIFVEYDSADFSYASSTAWATWPTAGFPNHTGFTGGSKLFIEYWMPCRHDSTTWGGVYMDMNITFDNGYSWRSAGGPGYGGSMMDSGTFIHGENQRYLITSTPASDYSVKLRWRVRRFNGSTLYINQIHAINSTSSGYCPAGTDGIADTRLGGKDSNQNYGSYRIMELIPK